MFMIPADALSSANHCLGRHRRAKRIKIGRSRVSSCCRLRRSGLVGSRTSLPYGIVIDSHGRPFFDLFGTNKIATIDPDTLEIVEYTLPAGARPRRIAVSSDDVIWYTDYARGFLGRLDPRTGDVTEFASPGGRTSQPYGMTSTSDGAIWYSESGVEPNTVVRFNPHDGSMQRWPIPSGGGVVRHMVTAPNDDVWLACSGVDRLARVRVVPPP